MRRLIPDATYWVSYKKGPFRVRSKTTELAVARGTINQFGAASTEFQSRRDQDPPWDNAVAGKTSPVRVHKYTIIS